MTRYIILGLVKSPISGLFRCVVLHICLLMLPLCSWFCVSLTGADPEGGGAHAHPFALNSLKSPLSCPKYA